MRRDPDRIDEMIERVRAVWKRHPDMRLGQLVANGAKFGPDVPVHLIEDKPLIAAIEAVHSDSDTDYAARRERFLRHLDEAAGIVATWPEWKRNILGRPRGEKPIDCRDNEEDDEP